MLVAIIGKGRMGQLIASTMEAKGHTVSGLYDINNADELIGNTVDLVIDFSHRDNLEWVIKYCQEVKAKLVYGTTGLNEQQRQKLNELSNTNAVFFSYNYSYGIAVMKKLLEMVAPLLEDDFDMEIVEKHHNQKQDAPSGTAMMLLEAIDPKNQYEHLFGRQGMIGKREKEIGIHALRGGSEAGEHTVYFFGNDESIEIKHHATSRQIFVNGACKAAEYLYNQEKGLYTMEDLIGG